MKGKGLLITIVVLALAATIIALGAGLVAAADSTGTTTLAQKIADRFGLNITEVEEVIEENPPSMHGGMPEGMHEQMHAKHVALLEQAVEDGTITEAQSEAILKEMDELHKKHANLANVPHEKRHELMKKDMDKLFKFAEKQGVDLKEIFGDGCGGLGGGMDMMKRPSMMRGTEI